MKAFGVTTTVPTEEDLEMTRKAATENPYTSKRFVPDKFLTVASRSADQVESSTTLAPMEPPPPVGDMDEMHTQVTTHPHTPSALCQSYSLILNLHSILNV